MNLCLCSENDKQNLIVKTDNGFVRGIIEYDAYGNNIFSFKGIPFAKPPVKNLRFKDPQPITEPWDGVLDATLTKPLCPQMIGGSEDCLYLNVFTPKLPTKPDDPLFPVMFYIFGGGFRIGFQPDGPKHLLTKNVILVEVNYRTNVFGFLSFEDPEIGVPGNAGLKDQNMGLHWVKNNIQAFGGDPNCVTIFGISAGGASVNFQVLSPMSKGLFHRAISASGVATCPWALSPRHYKELGSALGCKSDDPASIFDCINNANMEEIMKAEEEVYGIYTARTLGALNPFGPVIEEPNRNPFLTQRPEDILYRGTFNKVDHIFGFCKDEGSYWSSGTPNLNPDFKNSEDLIPDALRVQKQSTRSKTIGDKIKKFYYGDEIPAERTDIYDKYVADIMFTYHSYHQAKQIAKHVTTYFYQFSYITNLNIDPTLAPHNCDFAYLFSDPQKHFDMEKETNESFAVRRLITLWTNFAKTGDPNTPPAPTLINITWPPISKNEFYYLNIKPNLEVGSIPFEERMVFWEKLYHDTRHHKI